MGNSYFERSYRKHCGDAEQPRRQQSLRRFARVEVRERESTACRCHADHRRSRTICSRPQREIDKSAIAQKTAEYDRLFNNPYRAAARRFIDDVIEPRKTRPLLIRAQAPEDEA